MKSLKVNYIYGSLRTAATMALNGCRRFIKSEIKNALRGIGLE